MDKARKKQVPMHQEIEKLENLSLIKGTIKTKVMKKLGKSPIFFKIDAFHLWDNKWPVNVWCKSLGTGEGVVPSYKITDSFFVEVSKDNRMSSTPRIVKKY